jgi:molybdate transport system substrate-binding protein
MNRRSSSPTARRPWIILLVGLAVLGAACGNGKSSSQPEASTAATTATTAAGAAGDITVLAAASLTDAFNDIGTAFQAANPGSHVKFSYDASSSLATQANSGAPADVFASADDANMKKVTDAGNATAPQTFARNKLAIIVAKGNPKGITKLADFNKSSVIYVLCAAGVPCGTYGKQAADKAGVTRAPASLETNVKGVVTKVTSGQADAGIVYVTDAKAASANAAGVDIPDDLNVVATYPIAVLKQSAHADAARAFVDFVLSPQGQTILAKYGFLPAQ